MTSLISCRSLVQVYAGPTRRVVALAGLDLDVEAGTFVSMTGASGSGKSTLLRLLSGLEPPTAGSIVVDGRELASLDAAGRESYRREVVGVIQQQTASNLLPYLDARRNVEFPMSLVGVPPSRRRVEAMALLDLVGVGELAGRRPGELSGGQQQRVAIAVALANRPSLLLADEPTGELDAASTEAVVDAFERVVRELGATILAVTHDPLLAERTRRTVTVRHGRIAEETHRSLDGGEPVVHRFSAVDERGAVLLADNVLDGLGGRRLLPVAPEDRPWDPDRSATAHASPSGLLDAPAAAESPRRPDTSEWAP